MAEVVASVPHIRQAIAAYEALVSKAAGWSRACEAVQADLGSVQKTMDTSIDPRMPAPGEGCGPVLEGSAFGVPAAGMTGPGIDPMVDGIQEVLRTIPKHAQQLGEMEQFCGFVGEHYAGRAKAYRERIETLRELLVIEPGKHLDPGLLATGVEEPPPRPEPMGGK